MDFSFDGTGNTPKDNISLVVNGDTIIDIRESNDLKIPADANVIDLKGKTILPGFINAHVHKGYNEENLRLWARDGVTTVRDLMILSDQVSPLAFKAKVNGNPEFARLVSSGMMISAPNGYPFDFVHPPFLAVSHESEAMAQVNRAIREGADIIKIVVEDGSFFGLEEPTLSLEHIRAIVDAAHHHGTLVSAHITNANDLQKALDGNVDDIAHMAGDLIPAELIERMVNRNLYLEPTMELWNEGERILGVKSSAMSNLKNYVSAGGNVALGTDCGGHPQMTFEMGMPMKEILWMNEAGMTPLQIITACTRNAAYVCNRISQIGTLETGKKADILVVDGNPLNDLNKLKSDKLVIHHGKIIREFKYCHRRYY